MWQHALRDISNRYLTNIGDSARMFALAGLAAADAQIACWSTKYEYNVWRQSPPSLWPIRMAIPPPTQIQIGGR